mgnify:CR=1 FL=1
MAEARYGFRIRGPVSGERRLIDWRQAFEAYCGCDERARVGEEAYLSAFAFGADFAEHLRATGSTRGYAGPCGGDWLWIDLDAGGDADGLDGVLADARALLLAIARETAVAEDELLTFYSGSKGFHLGVPLAGFEPKAGPLYHDTARRTASKLAEAAGVAIDTGVYDRVRAFRAPNSRHPRTGAHKVRLTAEELLELSADRIRGLAAQPRAFDLADLGEGRCGLEFPALWNRCKAEAEQAGEAEAERRQAMAEGRLQASLNRATRDFIAGGASEGDRHRLLFSAAANLAELGAPERLAFELLAESALDSGLPPAEVDRQIRCGLQHARGGQADG